MGNWKNGSGRRIVLFWIYNLKQFFVSEEDAREIAMEYNLGFDIPLDSHDFEYAINGKKFEHKEIRYKDLHNKGYLIKSETLIRILNLSNEEAKDAGFYDYEMALKKRKDNRLHSIERDKTIAKLYLDGNGYRKIEQALPEQMKCSTNTIKNVIKRLGIQNRDIPFEKIDFNGKCVYSSYQRGRSKELSDDEERCKPSLYNTQNFLEDNTEEVAFNESGLTNEQQQALDLALKGANLLIKGRAGVGKTFLIEHIIKELKANGKVVTTCAPTVMVSEKIGGMTIHRLLGYKQGRIFDKEDFRDSFHFCDLLYTNTLIIDEAAMMTTKLMNYLGNAIEYLKKSYRCKIQVILVGDFLQLPPIDSEKDQFLFFSSFFTRGKFTSCSLTINLRQNEDKVYASCLNNIREGKNIEQTIAYLNNNCSHTMNDHCISIVATRKDALKLNNRYIDKYLDGELIQLTNELSVKVGAKVIFVKSKNKAKSHERKYANCEKGTIVKVSKGLNVVTIRKENGTLVKVYRHKLDRDNNEFDFLLGYAITTHKSQGMTLKEANINPYSFEDGQLYVALSRVESMNGVHLLAYIKKEYVKVNAKALAFERGENF